MYNNILNKKIPVLVSDSGGYCLCYYLQSYEEWELIFSYNCGLATTSAVKVPNIECNTIKVEYDDTINYQYFYGYFGEKTYGFKKTGDTWSCQTPYSEVRYYLTRALKMQYKTNQDHYAIPIGYTNNDMTFACNYPTDTGIHFDYFKFNKDETVEYTSKDITI